MLLVELGAGRQVGGDRRRVRARRHARGQARARRRPSSPACSWSSSSSAVGHQVGGDRRRGRARRHARGRARARRLATGSAATAAQPSSPAAHQVGGRPPARPRSPAPGRRRSPARPSSPACSWSSSSSAAGHQLDDWSPGRRRPPARSSSGHVRGRARRLATGSAATAAPLSSPACSWSSSAAGHQVGGDRRRGRAGMLVVELGGSAAGRVGGDRRAAELTGRARRHARGRARRLATRSATIAGAYGRSSPPPPFPTFRPPSRPALATTPLSRSAGELTTQARDTARQTSSHRPSWNTPGALTDEERPSARCPRVRPMGGCSRGPGSGAGCQRAAVPSPHVQDR